MNAEAAVNALLADGNMSLILDGRGVGLEKESLRITPDFALSRSPHPRSFGSKLTHPHITTDYSESLLELITPTLSSIDEAKAFLEDIHTFVYSEMGDDALWINSMPCIIKGETEIPIADYGTSNIGQMKKIYRRGLGHRYGRDMQTIAGVHFNYSFGKGLLSWLNDWRAPGSEAGQCHSQSYMAVVRNMVRLGWIIPYLFGASPAVCKSFLGVAGKLSRFDDNTLYGRYATSLRMGDIGYQNNLGTEVGFSASYNSLQEYIWSLKRAITKPCSQYAKIGIKRDGSYQQLNSNILQLDNEYYATVRPRCVPERSEMSVLALHRRGVEYVELRSLDINPFEPCGIGTTQLDFLELFTTYCLLADKSPLLDDRALQEIRANELWVAHQGRDPKLFLRDRRRKKLLREWGYEICQQMVPVSELLDRAHGNDRYSRTLKTHLTTFQMPDQIPSTRIIEQMRAGGESFAVFSGRKTLESRQCFMSKKLTHELEDYFSKLTAGSLQEQEEIEKQDTLSLDEYIENYYSQLQEIKSA